MPKHDEERAAELLERYVAARRSGRGVDIEALLGECPSEEREHLAAALWGTDLMLEHGPAEFVSPELVAHVKEQLAGSGRLHRSAEAARRQHGLQRPAATLAATSAVQYLAQLLQMPLSSAPSMPRAVAAQVMFRRGGRPSGSSASIAKMERRLIEKGASEKAQRFALQVGATEPPVDAAAIAERLGLLLLEEDMLDCDGCIVMHQDAAGIMVNRSIQQPGRKRFTVAHEMAHFHLHRAHPTWWDSSQELEGGWHAGHELEANSFAAELLFPRWYVRQKFARSEPTFYAIEQLAANCGASLTAAAVRYVRLSDFACAIVCSEGSRVRWFAASDEFPYWIGSGGPVHPSSTAALVADGEVVPDRAAPVPVSAWSQDGDVEGSEVWEWSRLLYGQVALTLLVCRELPGGSGSW